MNIAKFGRHLTLAFNIPGVKAYLGLQRSDNLNPVFVGIWLAFAKCWPESPGLNPWPVTFSHEQLEKSFLEMPWKHYR